ERLDLYRLSLSEIVTKDMIDQYYNKYDKEPEVRTPDVRSFFEYVKYINRDLYDKSQCFKNDITYVKGEHDPYLCKSCVSKGFLYDLGSIDGSERRKYLKKFGPYFPKNVHKEFAFEDLKKCELKAYIVGRNPHYT